MIDEIRSALGAYYLHIKWIHVMSAAVWSFSTAVAYVNYLKPAIVSAHRHPGDEASRKRRDEFMERFDKDAELEHYALAILIVTAALMLWLARVDLTHWSYFTAKVWIGILVIAPMEAIDIYLAHLGANKARVKATGDMERYEQVMRWHLLFLRITEPLVIILIPTMFFIAIVKPF